MTKLSRCKHGKDGVEASVSMSGFITALAECLDSALLGKSSFRSFYNCFANDGNCICNVWPPESHQGWYKWVFLSTPNYQGFSLPYEGKFCFFTPMKGRVNSPEHSRQWHRFMLPWEMQCMGCHVHVQWCEHVCPESPVNPSCMNPSQLSFLMQNQKALIKSIVFSCTILFRLCLSEHDKQEEISNEETQGRWRREQGAAAWNVTTVHRSHLFSGIIHIWHQPWS